MSCCPVGTTTHPNSRRNTGARSLRRAPAACSRSCTCRRSSRGCSSPRCSADTRCTRCRARRLRRMPWAPSPADTSSRPSSLRSTGRHDSCHPRTASRLPAHSSRPNTRHTRRSRRTKGRRAHKRRACRPPGSRRRHPSSRCNIRRWRRGLHHSRTASRRADRSPPPRMPHRRMSRSLRRPDTAPRPTRTPHPHRRCGTRCRRSIPCSSCRPSTYRRHRLSRHPPGSNRRRGTPRTARR